MDTCRDKRFSFFGNVTVGKDVSVKQLLDAYTIVILVRCVQILV